MYFSQKYFLVLIFVLFAGNISAQDVSDTDITIGSSLVVNPAGLNDELPFWLHANRNGMVNQYSSNALLYSSLKTNVLKQNHFRIDAGGKIVAQISGDPSLYFNTIYARATLGGWQLSAGRFIDPLAKKEDDLSIGSFLVSNNATPIPKIAFHTDGFISVPYTQGIVRFNAFYSHGWFEDNHVFEGIDDVIPLKSNNTRFTQNVYLHQKYLYLSIKYAFFDAVGGIVHNAQWGGVNSQHGRLPNDFQAYMEVVTSRGASSEDAPGGEQSNVIGNSIAAYDFSLGLSFNDFDLRAYRLFYLEDKISMRFRSPWDGLWGLTVKPKNIPLLKNVLLEHINTKRQDSFENHPYGRARYYYHFVYRTGWNYHGRVIGMPLIRFDEDGNLQNNIIIAYNLGFSGNLTNDLKYTFRGTFSRNYGTCFDQLESGGCYFEEDEQPDLIPLSDLRKDQYSLSFSLNYTLPENPDWLLIGRISTDVGELYTNRMGIELGVQWSGATLGF